VLSRAVAEVLIASAFLPRPQIPRDPADRIIAATARLRVHSADARPTLAGIRECRAFEGDRLLINLWSQFPAAGGAPLAFA
jgi:hypothetical protein